MKVFGIGLSKTGTTSLGVALSQLGFYHLHGPDVNSIGYWQKEDWKKLRERIEAYDSFEDWPWGLLYEKIDEWFPDSKFILTKRSSPEVWFESSVEFRKVKGPSPLRKSIFGFSQPLPKNKGPHIMFYKSHLNEVRKYFHDKPNKLLEVCWEEGDGWKELCDFLEVKTIPNKLFPHKNRKEANQKKRFYTHFFKGCLSKFRKI